MRSDVIQPKASRPAAFKRPNEVDRPTAGGEVALPEFGSAPEDARDTCEAFVVG